MYSNYSLGAIKWRIIACKQSNIWSERHRLMQRYDDETRNVNAYTLITLMNDALVSCKRCCTQSFAKDFFRIHFRSSQWVRRHWYSKQSNIMSARRFVYFASKLPDFVIINGGLKNIDAGKVLTRNNWYFFPQ